MGIFKLSISLIFSCVLFFGLSSDIFAAVKYVNGNASTYTSINYPTPSSVWGVGNDTTGDGSINAPWATIEKALESSMLTRGDTLYVASSTYTDTTPDQIAVAFGVGSGNTYIIGDGNPVFNMYSNPSQTWNFTLLTNVDGLVWDNIDITNNSSVTEYTFRIPSAGTFIFKNSSMNLGNPGTNYALFYLVGTSNTIVNVQSSFLGGCRGSCFFADNTGTSSITLSSSVIKDTDKLIQYNDPISTYIFNNTFEDFSPVALYFNYSSAVTSTTAQVANNIFIIDPDDMKPILRVSNAMETYFANHLSDWIFTNNIVTPDADSELIDMNYSDVNEIIYGDQGNAGEGDLFYFKNEKNWLIKIDFVDPTNKNYAIVDCASTFACGRGDSSYLPLVDILGNSWSGNHIGAFPNPTTTLRALSLNASSTAFIGDSILYGKWGGTSCPCSPSVSGDKGVWCWFDYYDGGCNSGLTVYAQTDAADLFDAMPSQRIQAIYWWADAIILTHKPDTVFMAGGLNNFDEYDDTTRPGDSTLAQIASVAEYVMKKAEYWGATPIWLGIGATAENIMDEDAGTYNTSVKSICSANGWTAYETLAAMQSATSSWAAYFYDDLDLGDVHPNVNGHALMANMITTPTITLLSSASDGTISWMTSEESSSLVDWGSTLSYENGTLEHNTSTFVTDHSVTIPVNAYPCSTIYFRARSRDAIGNEGSMLGNFISSGCSIPTTATVTIPPQSRPKSFTRLHIQSDDYSFASPDDQRTILIKTLIQLLYDVIEKMKKLSELLNN